MTKAANKRKWPVRALVGTALLVAFSWTAAQAEEYETKPREYVRVAIYNELHAHGNGEHFMWKDTDKKPKGTSTKMMVETDQGVIARLVAWNGRPLDAQQRAQDDAKIHRLLTDPSAMRKKQEQQHEDDDRAQRLLQAIPDAFLFKYVGVVEGKSGQEVHYTFQPDPNFNPPNRETRVFVGMKGDLFINLRDKRIAKIDAALFQPVEFGWGILGRLDKGGQFLIEQRNIDGARWETTHSILHFTGKALMFHAINIQEDETLSDFQPVKRHLTLAEGVDLLRKSDDVVAENGGATEAQK